MSEYDCLDLPEHELIDCGVMPKGGISAIGVLDASRISDVTDISDAEALQAAIDAGALKILKNIRCGIPEASAVSGDSLRADGAETITYNYDRTCAWEDGNVIDANVSFYNTLKRSRNKYLIFFNLEELTVMITPVTVSIDGSLVIPNTKKEAQKFSFKAMWTHKDDMAIKAADDLVSIFTE